MRVKTRLKNPRSTLGKSIKEILNRAGKRQISHPKQNQTYENDENASESRRSSTRINEILHFQNNFVKNNSNSNLILESISEEVEDQLFNESPIKKSINNKISELIPSQDQIQLDDITEEKSEINTSIISTNTKNSYSYLEEEDNFEFYPEYDYYKPRQPYEKPKKGSKRVKRKPNAAFIEEQQELNTGIDIESSQLKSTIIQKDFNTLYLYKNILIYSANAHTLYYNLVYSTYHLLRLKNNFI
ncbi:hypothetical protein TVAG_050040 [Trichomonas vaginalis G3]|uniref:Uncharacterized protein n=1 Tax=Trichomonas vaginalis (strain ATCC PRA-98 / G3) TaxID=412133 RepID=A2G9S4_TRIV3|nr:hypothetical protein TVAG_050040 [Trichomonas vaginalis G3]|eukprot:XP_001299025.1 hypothetical protein [Trichomonas vaginalis G3]